MTPMRVAVIDVGSNSVRLVIYDKRSRSLVPIFNEKGVLIHSPRIAAENQFFVSPVHIPIWYDYLHAADAQ